MKKKDVVGKVLGDSSKPQNLTIDPQKNLEKILQVEIAVADLITQTKEKAEKSIIQANDASSSIIHETVQKAHVESENIIQSGIATAKKEAEKLKSNAQKDSEIIIKKGEKYIDNAVKFIIALILEQDMDQEAK